MQVISVPNRLKLASSLMLLAVPIAAYEVILVTKAPWWKLPYDTLRVWCLAVTFICLPLIHWLWRGRQWAFPLTAAFGGLWCLLSALVTARLGYPGLAFFTAFLAFFWGALCSWIHHEISRSFFDPRMKWYQGMPPSIPGLRCELAAGTARAALRVSRIDRDGAFVVREPGDTFRLRPDQEAEMIFSYRERRVRCRGMAVRSLEADEGTLAAGFQFFGMSADAEKELGDFVETLRGEGHV